MLNTTYSIGSEIAANVTRTATHHGTSPVTYEQQVIIACFISVMGVWSTAGNLLTIFAILLYKHMRTKCNMFILSLAVSDLLSGLIASPLWLYRRTWGFYDWQWGQFLCKVFWFTDESTSYCTSLHIASFAVLRLIGVKWPQRFEGFKLRTVQLWLAFLWSLALIFGGFLFSLFYDVSLKDETDIVSSSWPSCSIRTSNDGVQQHKIYYSFSSTTFMFLPLLVLAIASTALIKELHVKRALKNRLRRKKERKASLQLALIVSSFLIGYLPMTAYVMWTTRQTSKDPLFDYWLHVTAYFLLRFSECMNPVIYNITSSHMRKASIAILRQLSHCNLRPRSRAKPSVSRTSKATKQLTEELSTPPSNLNMHKTEVTTATVKPTVDTELQR